MRILVTGGTGFFGFHIARALAAAGHEGTLLDLDPSQAAGPLPRGFRALRGDVRDRALLSRELADCDAIVHAAAGLPLERAAEIRSVNVDGARAVLECAEQQSPPPRVVHISSTAVYGIPKEHPLREEQPLHGVGPYGKSKVRAEALAAAARERGLVVAVLRPKTFIGPERLGVFQILFEWVRLGKRIPVIGDGRNRYQLLDVADAAAAVLTLVESEAQRVNRAFNVGALRFRSVAEDLGALFAHAGSGARLLPTPAPLAKGALAVLGALHLSPLYRWVWGTADQDSWVDVSALQALGWEPRYSNAETLIRTYDWYLENRAEMAAAGRGHRTPWREGVLAFLRRFL